MHPNHLIDVSSHGPAGGPEARRHKGPWRRSSDERSGRPVREVAPERRAHARLPLARAAQPAHGDMPPQGDRRQTTRSSTRHRPAHAAERHGQAAGFKGRGVIVAALLALALLSYGLMILAPQRIDLLPADAFTLPATATPAPGPASPSGPAVRHT